MKAPVDLVKRHCKPRKGKPLNDEEAEQLLSQVDGWQHEGASLTKTFRFKNYHETIAFINATAWVSHREDHHPDLLVLYNRCMMTYSTHSVGGLSENDFICAAKIDALLAL